MSAALIVATSNIGKAAEFAAMLGGFPFAVSNLSDYPPLKPPEEIGQTFCDNACLKAIYYAKQFQTWALADDSGLEVDALDCKPGVVSARWAELHEAGQGDLANNRLLLRQLENIPDPNRSGRFVCCLALANPLWQVVLTVQQSMEGRILHEPRGRSGFGYDPLFVATDQTLSNGEISSDLKHQISHRGKALRQLVNLMQEHAIGSPSSIETTTKPV